MIYHLHTFSQWSAWWLNVRPICYFLRNFVKIVIIEKIPHGLSLIIIDSRSFKSGSIMLIFRMLLTGYIGSWMTHSVLDIPWWRHQMKTFSASLAICAGNSPVLGESPAQRPMTRSFVALYDLRLNKRLSKQSWGWSFETPSRPLWRHRNALLKLSSWSRGRSPYSSWTLQCLFAIILCFPFVLVKHYFQNPRWLPRWPPQNCNVIIAFEVSLTERKY